MKKIYTLLMMAMVAMTFAACDNNWYDPDREDREEAYTLEGTWTGYIETYLYDRFGKTGNQYRTTMYFERENAYGGWGYEVDYNSMSPYSDYYYCEFEWDIYGGEIQISYADSWNPVYIYEYGLNGSHFWGYMDDGTSKDIYFNLAYDGRFDWSYWTRSSAFTRGANGKCYHASGEFANTKTTKEASN